MPRSTCVMVPRESFSRFPDALRQLAEEAADHAHVVAVDAGSPPEIAAELKQIARDVDVLLLRTDDFLAPNEARTVAMRHVSSEYVVFIDNDAFGTPGWLEALERCADDTGAWAVGPLYGIGHPDEGRVHMAGGRNRIVAVGGRRELDEEHNHGNGELVAVLRQVERSVTELVEFHCVLIRTEALRRVPIDPGYLSIFEHNALCLGFTSLGGEVWLEPSARVTYWPVTEPSVADRAYYSLRWSRSWNRASATRFAEEFGIPLERVLRTAQFRFATSHRMMLTSTGPVLWNLPGKLGVRARALTHRAERRLPVRRRRPWPDSGVQPEVVHQPAWAANASAGLG